jgi:hypothetical protein
MERIATNMLKRAQFDSIDSLASMAQVQRLHDEVIQELVTFLRSEQGGSHSWTDIGNALGIKRQSAQERFGKAD